MKIIGRAVGCGTEPTGSDEDNGAPLEGVYGFYGKIALRRSNQNNGARGCEGDKIPYYWGEERDSLTPKYAQPKNRFGLIHSLN